MVNIFKHRQIDNIFISYLKDFFYSHDKEFLKNLSGKEEPLEANLSENRKVILYDNSIFLVNKDYSNLGNFKIPIEELRKDSGYILFIHNIEEPDLITDFEIRFSSKDELYRTVNEYDSFNDNNGLKEMLLIMQQIGVGRIN